ncbi:MAG: hypothetical protein D6806_15830 [Deltaproteobacteria bacterium]|nr:MAG: hypothetical protein D6806_15830 [Deltaproteobacteria bacterium]
MDASLAVLEAPAAPAYELAHHAGCRVEFDSASGFRVAAGPEGTTSQTHLFAAGHCTGGMRVEQAVERGQSAADGLLESLAQRGG